MVLQYIVLCLGFILATDCSKLHEKIHKLPPGWLVGGHVAPEVNVTLEIQMKLNSIDKMIEALYAVSTPGDSHYGKHWSRNQVNALVMPNQEAILATVGWLNDHNIGPDNIVITASSVRFQTTVDNANNLLDTKFHHFSHSGTNKMRAMSYSVREDVAKHIDFIHPITYFGRPSQPKSPVTYISTLSRRALDSDCSKIASPNCIKQIYNIPLEYRPHNNANAAVGFGSFLGQSAQQIDQQRYNTRWGLRSPDQTFKVVTVNGGVNNQTASISNSGEANLDAQNLAGIAQPLPITEFITGGSPPFIPDLLEGPSNDENEPYLEYYTYLLSQENADLPQVLTQSYGEEEQTVPLYYAIRVCNMIAMMGLRGITIIESSGDNGVGASCRTNTGDDTPRFMSSFPGTCPYLLSVGGTQDIANETAWTGSSGGFSDYFPRPTYQQTAISGYLESRVAPDTFNYYRAYTNFSGRGFPDVAALSDLPGYYIYLHGRVGAIGGTSGAAPVWAGIIALLNDARLASNRSVLGWVNPYLYGDGFAALRDITAGRSAGCNGNNTQNDKPVPGAGVIPGAFWNATEGWDPVTGWGVPDFGKMLATWGTV